MSRIWLALVALLFLPIPSYAQEAIFTRSATQPAAEVLAWRQQFNYQHFENGMNELSERTILSYGLEGNLAVEAQLPFITMRGAGEDVTGAGDLTVLFKTRVWQSHTGAVDTARIGLFGGLALGVGPTQLTGGGVDPVVGAVFMKVAGRNGFNLATQYQLTTAGSNQPLLPGAGTSDLWRTDFAYLYRIFPEQYSTENDAAWYITFEFNNYFETDGDDELLFSPGILYEGTNCAIELGARVPVARHVTERPAQGPGVTVGFRLLY